ncbi:hypothetical protein [Paraburkholderia sacchari]|uniref:hypothetical protein n=1 Tax=Paraburkholderia sacchari TaxID=159450 RepID=UPI001BCB3825|nr:hypothetical protein [Paraburkholderia sacchari]
MDALTKERRLAINGLISRWMSEQDPEGCVLDTLDYFDVDKIDELIDEAIAPAIADAVAVSLAALPSDAAQAPLTGIPLLAADHKGMRVDYSGLLKQAGASLARGAKVLGVDLIAWREAVEGSQFPVYGDQDSTLMFNLRPPDAACAVAFQRRER